MSICMFCEEESSELTKIEITDDNGEVIPTTINGKEYESVLVCPSCMLVVFSMFSKGDYE